MNNLSYNSGDEITLENMQAAKFPLFFRVDDFYGTNELCKDFDIPVFNALIRIRFYPNYDPNCKVWLVGGQNTIGLQNIKKMWQLAYLYKLIMGTL